MLDTNSWQRIVIEYLWVIGFLVSSAGWTWAKFILVHHDNSQDKYWFGLFIKPLFPYIFGHWSHPDPRLNTRRPIQIAMAGLLLALALKIFSIFLLES